MQSALWTTLRCSSVIHSSSRHLNPVVTGSQTAVVRTDLTLRASDGTERDVAVLAPEGTTFGDVAAQLAELLSGRAPSWSGSHRVDDQAVVGRAPLVAGTVLRDHPPPGGDPERGGTRLEIIGGSDAGRSVTVGRCSVTLGRSPSCDLVLCDPHVSRQHATVTMTPAGASIRDLDSTHGTWVDGGPLAGERALPNGSLVRVGDTFLRLTSATDQAASTRAGPGGTILVNRPPRARTRPIDSIIEVPVPPRADWAPRIQWAAAVLPAIAGVVLALVVHSPQFLAFAALTPIAIVAATSGDRLHWRRSRRRTVAEYRRRLMSARDETAAAIDTEAVWRRVADPDPSVVLAAAATPTVRLWERQRRDDGLLRVRIGLASLPSATQIERGGVQSAAATLAAVPFCLDLADGALGVAAPTPMRDGLARWIVAQLGVLTSPADVELALLLSDDGSWTWARWLPHLRGRLARTPAERNALVAELAELVQSRRELGIRHGAAGAQPVGRRRRTWDGPHLVVVLDGGEAPAGLGAVLADGLDVGITALCLHDRAQELPNGCAVVIRPTNEVASTVQVDPHTMVADRVDPRWAERVARTLAPLRDGNVDPWASLPTQCRLAELENVGARRDVVPSGAEVRAGWLASSGSPSAVLGTSAAGPLVVDLQRDGPHALVAGTTGAGKSELLQTLVTGLALRHPPSELTFLLIDYKGGAAFAECGELPHTVGMVTDLDEQLTRRVLVSLDGEIRRREALLGRVGASDLAAYRAGGAALPRLVLVIDEFATLTEELPGFVPGLVSIAQRGRSLGLHLVLATQRPAGVVSPEIRANTALRIALRMTSATESMDVIDGPEAAGIDRRMPGRAYLRCGSTTVAFQTARVAGVAAAESGSWNGCGESADSADRIRVVSLGAWLRAPDTPPSSEETDLRRYVAAIREAAAGRASERRPWLPPLPASIRAAELPNVREGSGIVAIGLLDLPEEQDQQPLTVDVSAGGTLLIAGSARSGRTTALLTLALSAAERRSPRELHLHVIDGAGTGLPALHLLPHLGTTAAVHHGMDLVARLVQRLHSDFARRRAEHNRAPTVLLLVDGWDELLAASEEFDGGRTVERVLALLRDAPAAGGFVAVAGGRAALAPRLAAQMTTRLVLRLHDPGDYAQVGIGPRSVPPSGAPGRGVRAPDGASFQIALADDAAAVSRWRGQPSSAVRLRGLPARVRLDELPNHDGRCLLGVAGDAAAPLAIDPAAGGGRLLVAGPARSGRSTLLCTVLRQTDLHRLMIAAPRRSPLAAAAHASGLPVLDPTSARRDLDGEVLLLDDAEAFVDTDAGDALARWLRAEELGRAAIVAGRSDALAVAFRGLGAVLRQCGAGVLLQPGPVDGELLGVDLPRARASAVPGRGVLVPDPAWGVGEATLPLQVALP